jgi:hypothetical protein
VTIAGAAQRNTTADFTITVTDSTHFTYAVTGTPTTPATGTITANRRANYRPWRRISGRLLFRDGRECRYLQLRAERPDSSWGALDFITAAIEPGGGVALAKSQNYLIAFKEWSSRIFLRRRQSDGVPAVACVVRFYA